MADTPESSENMETEGTSTAEENINLVDVIDDLELYWVGAEPQGMALIYNHTRRKAYTVVEYGAGQEGFQRNFKILRPAQDARICSEYIEDAFPMYEVVLKDLGLRLPFNDFQMGVFSHLSLAPSQLHPNAIAFIRAFKLTCRFLRIEATISLFFRVFHLQWQSRVEKHSWVSLKQSKRLFGMYMDSVRDFKDKCYILQPSTQTTLDSLFDPATIMDEDGDSCLDTEGNPEIGRISKFPIHWCSGHYDHGSGHYHTSSSGMSVEDEEAYGVLNHFVDGFFHAKWVTQEGRNILDEDDDPMFEARSINTKALVEYQSYGQAVDLLGFFAYFYYCLPSFVSSTKLTRTHFLCFCRSHGGAPREIAEADYGEKEPQEIGETSSSYAHGFILRADQGRI
ncbi:unnamed protein product [Vicia faba]|uniref:Transposase (putative) gypsy type domain-containing protein n=1 Tax=Vicia faba TaxID=3906 RepID=A0AAV0ZS17_VICFA|nr:unnamed protein product [Vicia faba]